MIDFHPSPDIVFILKKSRNVIGGKCLSNEDEDQ